MLSNVKNQNQFCGLPVVATPGTVNIGLSQATNLKSAKGLFNCPWRFFIWFILPFTYPQFLQVKNRVQLRQ
jgi:hypothetical protein